MELESTKYEGIKLEEYKGNYSLCAMKLGDGKNYPIWAKYRKGKDNYQDRDWPVKVSLGDRATAANNLRILADSIEQGKDVPF
jgi:hypothetical protein